MAEGLADRCRGWCIGPPCISPYLRIHTTSLTSGVFQATRCGNAQHATHSSVSHACLLITPRYRSQHTRRRRRHATHATHMAMIPHSRPTPSPAGHLVCHDAAARGAARSVASMAQALEGATKAKTDEAFARSKVLTLVAAGVRSGWRVVPESAKHPGERMHACVWACACVRG